MEDIIKLRDKLIKMWFIELKEFERCWENELEFRVSGDNYKIIINKNWERRLIIDLYDK